MAAIAHPANLELIQAYFEYRRFVMPRRDAAFLYLIEQESSAFLYLIEQEIAAFLYLIEQDIAAFPCTSSNKKLLLVKEGNKVGKTELGSPNNRSISE